MLKIFLSNKKKTIGIPYDENKTIGAIRKELVGELVGDHLYLDDVQLRDQDTLKGLSIQAQSLLSDCSTTQTILMDETHTVMGDILRPLTIKNTFEKHNLQTLLDEPLVRKIPSVTPPRNQQEKLVFEHSTTISCPELEATIRLALAGTSIPGSQASEMDWSGYWDSFFFAGFLRMAIRNNLLTKVVAYRNAEESSSTAAKHRRDFNLQGNNILLVAGEDKPQTTDASQAKDELLNKTRACTALYGNLKYFFAFTTAGAIVEFFVIVLPDEGSQHVYLEPLHRKYDVAIPMEREALYKAFINICRWVRSVLLLNLLDGEAIPSQNPIPRKSPYNGEPTSTIVNKGEFVRKRIWLPKNHIDQFEAIYVAVQEINSKYHCKLVGLKVATGQGKGSGTDRFDYLGRSFVQPNLIANNTGVWVTLDLAPIGARRIPGSDEEIWWCFHNIFSFLELFHAKGFVHRDLRWANILRHQDKNWFIIDFEMAGAIGAKPWWNNSFMHITKDVSSTVYTDLYQVGILLEDTGKFVAVSSKLKNDRYNNASEVLADLKKFANSDWACVKELSK